MARKRKKRPAQHPPDSETPESAETDLDEELESFFEGTEEHNPDESYPPAPELDNSCLLHPRRELQDSCGRCSEALCPMCAVPFGSDVLCSECFSEAMRPENRTGGAWQGWVAMMLGMLAAGAVSFQMSGSLAAQIITALPGGSTSLASTALVSSGSAVWLGFAAQDFPNLARRAGAVGAAVGVLTLLVLVGLRVRMMLGG